VARNDTGPGGDADSEPVDILIVGAGASGGAVAWRRIDQAEAAEPRFEADER
jgi:hypothetical protein